LIRCCCLCSGHWISL